MPASLRQLRRTFMWHQPYLETCCRAALHRLYLCGLAGRPAGQVDEPCLRRLTGMGLAEADQDGRYRLTPDGDQRHSQEIQPQAKRGRQAAGL